MNLPNKITVGRFGLTLVLFGWFVWTDTASGPAWWQAAVAGLGFILAVATDALDGYYARKLGQISDFGRIADPVVDKVIVCGTFIFLVSVDWTRPYVPVWVAVVIVGREFLVNALRSFIEAKGVAFPSRWDGKAKMILQCHAIPAVFLVQTVDLAYGDGIPWLMTTAEWLAYIFVWSTVVLTITSGLNYITVAAKVLRTGEAVSS